MVEQTRTMQLALLLMDDDDDDGLSVPKRRALRRDLSRKTRGVGRQCHYEGRRAEDEKC